MNESTLVKVDNALINPIDLLRMALLLRMAFSAWHLAHCLIRILELIL